MTTLDSIEAFAAELSPWAHLATVGADGEPDVVPVHPCWEGDVRWTRCGADSVKARNVADNPRVALYWQVTEVFDDLDIFSPGGPDNSPGTAVLAIHPTRAQLLVRQHGMGGRESRGPEPGA